MNILLIHHFGGMGGGTVSCLDVAESLVKQGHSVTIATISPCQYIIDVCKKNNINLVSVRNTPICLTYHSASSGFLKALSKLLFSRKSFSYWKSFFKQGRYDIVMLNSIVQAPMIPILRKLKIANVCFVRETIRGTVSWPINKLIRHYLNLSDAVVFLTKFDRDCWKLPKKTSQHIIPDIVNSDNFKAYKSTNNDDNKKSILYLGGFAASKGALDLLKAFEIASLKIDNLHLTVLGHTYEEIPYAKGIKKVFYFKFIKYAKKCKELCKKINTDYERINVVGLTDEVYKWYAKSDVVVFPVTNVHQARPVYEAGFYSIPVIVPDFNNFSEAVTHGVNGLCYEKGNIADLARCIEDIFRSNELEIMGIRNHEKYLEAHTVQVLHEKIKSLLEEFKDN